MDGSVCINTAVEPLDVHPQAPPSEAARTYFEVADVKPRRPLSPICPYTSLAEIPKPKRWWHNLWTGRAMPLALSIALHATVLIGGYVTFEINSHRTRLDRLTDAAIRPAATEVGAAVTLPPVDEPESFLQSMSEKVDAEVEVTSSAEPREPRDAAVSQLDDDAKNRVAFAAAETIDEPIVLGMSIDPVASAPAKRTPEAEKHIQSQIAAQPAAATIAPSGSAAPASTTFFGITGNARSIVYLCDASGSMLGTDDTIETQLQRAVLALHPTQEFNVMFFSGASGAPAVRYAAQLVPADPNNKLSACAFAKKFTPRGKTNPLPAICAALKFKPDVLYFVTDGALDDQDEQQVLNGIRKANSDRTTQINVILINGAPQHDSSGIRFLRSLAEETGGRCLLVNPETM